MLSIICYYFSISITATFFIFGLVYTILIQTTYRGCVLQSAVRRWLVYPHGSWTDCSLRELHWLQVAQRIDRVPPRCLVRRCLNGSAVSRWRAAACCRSRYRSGYVLHWLRCWTFHGWSRGHRRGDRAFPVTAATVWKCLLPDDQINAVFAHIQTSIQNSQLFRWSFGDADRRPQHE